MIKVAIVDDKPQQRDSVAKSLGSNERISVVLKAKNGRDFIEQMESLDQSAFPHVVLMDIDMPVMNGIQTVEIAKVKFPDIHFLMFTVFDDDERIFDAIRAGAGGYLLKDEKIDTVVNAIYDILEVGGVPMSPMIARKAMNLLMQSPKPVSEKSGEKDSYNLSARELEILKLVVDGFDSAEIGEKLFISPLTVRKHVANIYTKLHVSNKAEAVKLAVKRRWFDL